MPTQEAILAVLGARYDHFSARAVFGDAVAVAGIERKATYDAAETEKIAGALPLVGDRVDQVVEGLKNLSANDAQGKAAPKEAAPEKAAPEKAAPKEAAPEKAEAKEAKAPAKKKGGKKK